MKCGQKHINLNTHQPFAYVHLFNCLLMQISNQSITWQRLKVITESFDFYCNIQMEVRIWQRTDENMAPSCPVSMIQAAGGVMVSGIFSWQTLGHLVPLKHYLNTTV